MLPDCFFTEYGNTGTVKPVEPVDHAAEPEKEYYSKAEVDTMINDRIGEVIAEMRNANLHDIMEPDKPSSESEEVETEL